MADREAGLVGVRHDREVEQRGRFDRVLVGEPRTDEGVARLGQRTAVGNAMGDPDVVLHGHPVQVPVPPGVAGEHAGRARRTSSSERQGSAPTHRSRGVRCSPRARGRGRSSEPVRGPDRRSERPPGASPSGLEFRGRLCRRCHPTPRRTASGVTRDSGPCRLAGCRERTCCMVDTNARVDSAPWFSLRPSRSNPSKPPPLRGS